MRNLAGDKEADYWVQRELTVARLAPVEGAVGGGEVPTTMTATLPGFTFKRAWSYWIVKGNVPVDIARKLYADPCGRTDIRVAGHCGCPPPEPPWTNWLLPDGKEVVETKYEAEIRRWDEKWGQSDFSANLVYSDDPESIGAAEYVTMYHIDSEVGLRVFVDALGGDRADREG